MAKVKRSRNLIWRQMDVILRHVTQENTGGVQMCNHHIIHFPSAQMLTVSSPLVSWPRKHEGVCVCGGDPPLLTAVIPSLHPSLLHCFSICRYPHMIISMLLFCWANTNQMRWDTQRALLVDRQRLTKRHREVDTTGCYVLNENIFFCLHLFVFSAVSLFTVNGGCSRSFKVTLIFIVLSASLPPRVFRFLRYNTKLFQNDT